MQNIGTMPADNVTLTTAMLGSTAGLIAAPNLNIINFGGSVSPHVFTSGASGTAMFKLGGTYGPGIGGRGSFGSTTRNYDSLNERLV